MFIQNAHITALVVQSMPRDDNPIKANHLGTRIHEKFERLDRDAKSYSVAKNTLSSVF
jgi:hypothetical protein